MPGNHAHAHHNAQMQVSADQHPRKFDHKRRGAVTL